MTQWRNQEEKQVKSDNQTYVGQSDETALHKVPRVLIAVIHFTTLIGVQLIITYAAVVKFIHLTTFIGLELVITYAALVILPQSLRALQSEERESRGERLE